MKIRDIVNRNIAHLSNCDEEPIHVPGAVQPHGCLLAVEPHTLEIQYCTANAADFFQLPPANLLNQSLAAIWPQGSEAATASLHIPQQKDQPLRLQIGEVSVYLLTHHCNGLLLLEIEKEITTEEPIHSLFEQTKEFITLIERSRSLQQLCQRIAEQTRRITGYDRVMIYRFDKNYNGEVYAESKRRDLEPLLGLHYPHTDIPPQARQLYLRQQLRLIPDVGYEPVPLLTQKATDHTAIDMSDVGIRSVSPLHIQYLKNMEVGATLTISLLLEGKLWGLIACHHQTPKNLSMAQRQAAMMQGHFLTSQIRVQQVAEEYEVNQNVEAHLQQLLNKIEGEEDFSLKFDQFTSLLQVVNATGVVVLYKGDLYEKGLVPQKEETLSLIRWIADNIRSVQFCTSFLSSRFTEAAAFSRSASGILYHALGKPTESCVIWFREEMEFTIDWAGNPNDAVLKEAGQLTPRKSFSLWQEVVRYHSKDWRVSEINAANRFANTLQNHFHLAHLKGEEIKLRYLNESLQKANAELSNINWITSHDLKEPLRKIQMFASRITHQEPNLSQDIQNSIERIRKSAGRMQHLVDDILNYSVTGRIEEMFEIVDLQQIVNDVLDELTEEIKEGKAEIQVDPLPTAVKAIPYQMTQLFTNLLSNSLKYRHAERSSTINITCAKLVAIGNEHVLLQSGKPYYRIDVQDNGIGFDPQFNARIFDIFYRLHNNNTFSGTGIGLALCRKIAENHRGAIAAEGIHGKGAVFHFYLPA